MSAFPPVAVRSAGFIVAAEGLVGLGVAAVLAVRGLAGADQRVIGGPSLAICLALVAGGVLAAGWALVRGHRWGRGAAVFTNLLLLPVAWYAAVDSHRWVYGIPVGLFALGVLGLLFSPSAVRWVANAASASPDTR